MKKFFHSGCLLLLMVLFSSCASNLKEVRIDDFRVDNISSITSSKLAIGASIKVHNPTKKKLVLKSAELDVLSDGIVFAHLHLPEEIAIPARSDDYNPLQLELKITNMMVLLTSGIDIRNIRVEQFIVNGSLKLKSGALSRKLEVKEVTLEQLLNSL